MPTKADRHFSAAAANNAAPIVEVLRHEFRHSTRVLEIGSGTGQHAIAFASELPLLDWQTSDLEANHAGIEAWLAEAKLANVRPPIVLDVTRSDVSSVYDAVYSANTAHIMSLDAVRQMFILVGKVLRPGGVFCLYGPFRRSGAFNAASNRAFDASLRSRDSAMGIRDLEALDAMAEEQGLEMNSLYAVPSNNMVVVWQKNNQSVR